MVTVNYLKELFLEKYGSGIFTEPIVEISVTLTKVQYSELNDDLMGMTGKGILLMVDESDITFMNPEDILYTRIVIPVIRGIKCEFMIKLGNEFEFKMTDASKEYGTEEL